MKTGSACRAASICLTALGLTFAAGTARAQRGIDSELFHPALDSYGIFSVERAQTAQQWDFGFKLFANYASNPLRLDMTDPATLKVASQTLMTRQIALNFGFDIGLTNWLELALDIPISSQAYSSAYGTYGSAADPMISRTGFYAADPYTNVPPPDASPLDTRLALKARIFRKGDFGLAAAASVTLPFGDDSAFLGDSGFTFRPLAIADFTRGPITIAINGGAILRPTTRVFDPYDVANKVANPRLLIDLGDELTWSAGFAYRFIHWVGVAGEVYGYTPLNLDAGAVRDNTADVLGGLQIYPARDLAVAVGAGADVFASAYRHDAFRVFAGLTWAPVGGHAQGFAGGIDTDGDGIPDSVDQCPNEPEDKDGFQDEDGCPDPDNDGDGIPDKADKCPNEAEDKDGFQDEDGCPDLDNDQDGIPDAQDKCPNDPEDMDGFQDDDGCPDLDNDGDGVVDSQDKCPNEPGPKYNNGCPDSGTQVQITGQKISIPEQIVFQSGKAVVSPKSFPLIQHIADALKANPRVRRVRIEGHTDDVGSARKNLALSQARAEAVRDALIARGIDPQRLQAVGYGSTRPLEKGHSSAARAKNRRVEFIIVEQ